MPTQPQKRKINPLAIVAVILLVLAAGMLFLIFAPGPRMKWALTMGEKYLTDCEYTQAVTMFSRAIRVDDRSEPAYLGRAEAYIQLNQPAAAVDDLTFVIDELTTDDADVYIQRAEAYTMLGNTEAAQADLDTAASLGADTTAAEETLAALTPEPTPEPEKETRTVSLPIEIQNYVRGSAVTTLQYSDDGKLQSYVFQDNYGSNNRSEYDEHENVVLEEYTSGNSAVYTYTYDNDGKMLTYALDGGTYQWAESYTYDSHGNMTHLETNEPRAHGMATDWKYAYNGSKRIADCTGYYNGEEVYTDKYTYTDTHYTIETIYAVQGEDPHRFVTYTSDGIRQYEKGYMVSESGGEFLYHDMTYNADGNIVSEIYYNEDGTPSYTVENTYDDKGRLTQHSESSNGTISVMTYTYIFDADGNAIGRTAYTDGALAEQITYTVMEMPSDYTFVEENAAQHNYKSFAVPN